MDILKGENSASAIGAAILKGFSNLDDIVKSEEQERIEKAISEGTVKVVSIEDISKNYGGKFFTPKNISKCEVGLNSQIEKGEKDYLTMEEFEELEEAQEDFNSLEEVIVKGEIDGDSFMQRVFVQRHIADEEE